MVALLIATVTPTDAVDNGTNWRWYCGQVGPKEINLFVGGSTRRPPLTSALKIGRSQLFETPRARCADMSAQ